MTRILHVIDTYGPGGAETVCLSVVSGLDPAQFQSRVIVTGQHWLYDNLVARGFEAVVIPVRRPVDDLRLVLEIARQIVTWQPDVVQTHLINSAIYGSVTGRLLRVPVVATFHGENDLPQSDPHRAAKLAVISRASSRLAFVSGALRTRMVAGTSVRPEHAAVIYNGIDTSVFRPGRSSALRALLGVGDQALIVGAVGNMRAGKGYDVMLRVMHELRGRPDVHLAIVGWERPPVQGQLLALRAELGLEQRVHFLGFRDNVAELVPGMDVYLSTSVSEGFSLTTVQAMACGVPVVCTRSGGPEEIVSDGVEGLLVPVGDVPSIAAAVDRLLADAPLRSAMGERGRHTAVARFDVRVMAEAYARIYRELAGR